jgi:hypothetical protein
MSVHICFEKYRTYKLLKSNNLDTLSKFLGITQNCSPGSLTERDFLYLGNGVRIIVRTSFLMGMEDGSERCQIQPQAKEVLSTAKHKLRSRQSVHRRAKLISVEQCRDLMRTQIA